MSNNDWTEPGVFEVVPGVYRIPLPLPNDGLRAVNVYVVTGPDGLVLIDSGWSIPDARTLLADGLAELGATFEDIARFLITHVHRDHYSQAVSLRRDFGMRVTLGAEEHWTLDTLLAADRKAGAEQLRLLTELGAEKIGTEMRAMQSNHSPGEMIDWEMPDDWFTDGEVIDANGRSLEAVATPGHTRGHTVFYDNAASLLFAGDHVLPTITPSIGFEPAFAHNPLGAFLESLAIVRGRPDAMLLPAHGSVTASAHDRVDELVEHHRLRLDAMAAALGSVDTAAQVAAIVTWTRRERTLDELDLFNRFLAVCETGAHLELLAVQGRVTRTMVDGVRHYTVNDGD